MHSRSTLLFLLLWPFAAFAAKGDEEHKIRVVKEFKAGSGSDLAVLNKYGKIVIKVWDKPVVRAEIEIVGFGKNQEQARSIAEMVNIAGSESGSSIRIETKYNPGGSRWFSFGRKDSRDYVNINYVVNIPRNIKAVALENQFGDILARDLPFDTRISVNYGFFDIGNAEKLKVTMNYTDKARIEQVHRLELNANYSSLRCGSTKELKVNSNNSSYTFGEAGNMRLNSNYDEYRLTAVNDLSLSGNYSNLRAETLKKNAVFNVNYTDLNIRRVDAAFSSITAHLRYSDLKLGMADRSAFRITANLHHGSLTTGDFEWKNVTNIRKNNNLSFSAITSNGTDASGLIKIDGAYCDVKLAGE
ncbi:hypothetical protein [Chitinophaga alhagiae]|uniref:hypothetical protein n=1 Tax=Chitinophaga alhagiae TaxID=2203219 RepID=UPI00130076CB|nr:hypothetical protein [Chitinophaga alhagiae]